MKKWLLACLVLLGLLLAVPAHAQYKAALGARLGPWLGLTFKYNLDDRSSLEFLGETRLRAAFVTGLYEFHFPFNSVDGLRAYIGAGGHAGYLSRAWTGGSTGRTEGFTGGLDGIIGIEYTFPRFPINISADWKPILQFWGGAYWDYQSYAFSIRYAFGT